jgi:hypothetical protein
VRYAAKKKRQRDTHRARQAAHAVDHQLLDSAIELANYERYRIHTTVDPTATSPIFSFSAQAGHVDALRTLLDSGANLNVMAEEVVRREGFQQHAAPPQEIELADGSRITSTPCVVRLPLEIRTATGTFTHPLVEFAVLPSGLYDMILGDTFLRANGANLSYTDGTVTMHNGAVTLTPSSTFVPRPELLSASGLRRAQAAHQIEALYVVRVSSSDDESMPPLVEDEEDDPDLDNDELLPALVEDEEDDPDFDDDELPALHSDSDSDDDDFPPDLHVRSQRFAAAATQHAPTAAAQTPSAPRVALDKLRAEILTEYEDILVDGLPPGVHLARLDMVGGSLGQVHHIPTVPGAAPPSAPVRRMAPAELLELRRQLKMFIDKDFIRPSQSPYGACVLFAKKKDGGLRLCLDYRALNKISVKNSYPLPRIDEILDSLQGATCFSGLDLASGYFQIPVAPEDVEKTAFRTRYGSFEFLVMPFGLTNAPATFQTLMNDIFREYLDDFVVIYLDDIMVFSKNPADHAKHLRIVFDILRTHKLYAQASKCHLCEDTLEFLGHIISAAGAGTDPKKVEAVQNWAAPANLKELRSFLGFANFYRRFIPNFAHVAGPLNQLLKADVPYIWTATQQAAFELLKQRFATAPVLALPDFRKDFVLFTDASDYALGACLSQEDATGELRPIAYESRTLTPAERNYATHEKEMLAIIHALKVWRHYLLGSKTSVNSDHRSLTHFLSQPNLSQRQARWMELLQEYDLKIEYVKGSSNVVADALSRLKPETKPATVVNTLRILSAAGLDIPPPEGSTDPFRAITAQFQLNGVRTRSGTQLQYGGYTTISANDLHAQIQAGYTNDSLAQEILAADPAQPDYVIRDGLIYYVGRTRTARERLYVPNVAAVRSAVLREHHDATSAGHLGRDKTLAAVERHYFWPKMRDEVETYVKTCPTCQLVKPSNRPPNGQLQPLPIPDYRWQQVSMDFIMQLPITARGHTAIVVFVDKLSKMVHLAPTTVDVDASTTARIFFDHVFRLHGMPETIISDRDPRFTSTFWKSLFQLVGTQLAMSTAFHPQTDGQTERANRTIEDVLRCYSDEHQTNWDELLTPVEFTINNSVQASINESPFYLNYGRHPATPAAIASGVAQPSASPSADKFVIDLHATLTSAKKHLVAAQERQKKHANKRRTACTFAAGDQVLLSIENLKLPGVRSRKLTPRFCGPFTVLKTVGPNAVKIDLHGQVSFHDVINVSRLKRFNVGDADRYPGRQLFMPPPPDVIDGEEHYTVQAFLDSRFKGKGRGRHLEYLVRWEGYPPDFDEWISAAALQEDLDPDPYKKLRDTLAEKKKAT